MTIREVGGVHRVASRAKLSFVSLLVSLSIASFGAPALADDAPLVLSGNDIGLTSEDLDAREAAQKASEAPAPEAAVPTTNEPLELTLDEEAEPAAKEAEASEWTSNDEPVVTDDCPTVGSAADIAVASFEGCVESAIRGGNGYDESSRVCRTLFPES